MTSHLRSNRFEPFRLVTEGEVVGSHDGSRATLHLGALDDEVVYHHEYGHEVLFSRSTDGSILALLWRVMDEPGGIRGDELSAFSITADTLATGSIDAQETFATYYGIKLVAPEVGKGYIRHLPANYKAYYEEAATVIDPLFASTFMQVRVALTLTHFAFDSRFAARFLRNPRFAYQTQDQDEEPNHRLRALLSELGARGKELRCQLSDAAKQFFERRQVTGWNLNDEEAWRDQGTLANLLDLELDGVMASWLRSRRVVPFLTAEERVKCGKRLIAFARELCVDLRQTVGTEVADIPDLDAATAHFRRDAATRAHAWKQAGSFIANSSIGRTLPGADGAALWEIDDYRNADKLVVISGDPDDLPDVWTVLRDGPEGAQTNLTLGERRVFAVHYLRDDVISWLNQLQPEHGWTGPQPYLIISPIGSERKAGNRAFSYGPAVAPGYIDPRHNDRMALYVMGNWFDFIEAAAQTGSVRLAQISADLSGYGEQLQPLVLKVARCEGFPGPWFLRSFAPQAAASAALLELDWQHNPAIQSVSISELLPDETEELLKRTMSSILALWSRL
ncbi:hypothetical protein [Thauera sp. Sel9]|uniref:hypothetical protein n=1 Tax=Thauera sp. Sel9 TaxID=2974299 RepID=UPI0021E141C8|nr:hypothetical protein [Thauera sp. Sel9]MCV2218531.1 hypothetical protein [Thauera sp. Sel9]